MGQYAWLFVSADNSDGDQLNCIMKYSAHFKHLRKLDFVKPSFCSVFCWRLTILYRDRIERKDLRVISVPEAVYFSPTRLNHQAFQSSRELAFNWMFANQHNSLCCSLAGIGWRRSYSCREARKIQCLTTRRVEQQIIWQQIALIAVYLTNEFQNLYH